MLGRSPVDRTQANIIGENIRRERVIRKWTQADLSDKAGVSCKMISNFERGVSIPNAWQIKDIAEACGTPIEIFYRDPTLLINNPEITG